MFDIEDEVDASESTGSTLIRSYGLYWSRDAVNWNSQELSGDRRHYRQTVKNQKKKAKVCNVWKVRGVYALYSDFRLVYVGLAGSKEGIGSRLKSHTEKPRFEKRWDSFSWFGIDGFRDDGTLEPYDQDHVDHSVSVDILVRSFELITILISDPPLNRSQGRFKGAEAIVQSPKQPGSSPSFSDLEDQLKELKKLITNLKER